MNRPTPGHRLVPSGSHKHSFSDEDRRRDEREQPARTMIARMIHHVRICRMMKRFALSTHLTGPAWILTKIAY